MKRLLRQTSTLLRTAILFGAIALIIPTQAQTAGLPDAFETMDPATIIGDGNYYYIQFYDGDIRSYLTDCGVAVNAESKDFLPYANNRLWTLLPAGDGDATHFYLKNKAGHFLYFESGGGARVKCTDNFATASILQLTSLGDGYRMSSVAYDQPMYRNGNAEWSYLPCNAGYYGSRIGCYRLRFVKLKSNSAFLIYYRGEGADNSDPNAEATRHYLTYSGTGETSLGSQWWRSDVSSRQSIIPKDKALPSLPTLAAYHKDGLWTIEKADVDGQFYIKKYGTEQYLNEHNHSGVYDCELGTKDAVKGTYTLETPSNSRYTRVQNVKYDSPTTLTADMFYNWDGYGSDANSTESANLSLNYGTQESPLNGGDLVAGTGGVLCQTYADLSTFQKMTINGTPNMQLRVLMNRQEHDSGPYVEKDVTIGSDGKALIDLTDLEINRKYDWPTVKMTYVDANHPDDSYGGDENGIAWGGTAKSGYNNISDGAVGLVNFDWGANCITYLQVDASAIRGRILNVKLKADVSGPLDNGTRNSVYGVGYNNSTWKYDMTYTTADKSITTIGSTVSNNSRSATTFVTGEFNITQAFTNDDDNIVTILVYETAAAGGYIKNPWVEVEYIPDVKEKMSYAHLNAIKTGWGSPSGTISSITLEKMQTTDIRYLHHAHGDGWQVLQWKDPDDASAPDPDYFYAAFYPVEVVDKDEYYRVRLQLDDQMVGVSNDSKAVLKPNNTFNPELWTLEQFGDYRQYRLKSWDGTYYSSLNNPLVDTAPTSGNGVFTNSEINSIFSNIEWVRYIPYETRIKHNITHKVSALREFYTDHSVSDEQQKLYRKQGLATNADPEWWNRDSGTQNVNEFKITHYVKKGDVVQFGLPTVLTTNNDHRLYQRWYNYKNDTDLEGLKNHFKLKTSDGEVMSYLYNNGIVTGEKLDWPEDLLQPGAAKSELRYFTFNNFDGERFTLAGDVSRYSDFTYQNTSDHLDGDLQEPTLTMRYIFYMRDAKEMARKLMACTGDKWYEEKTFHFPATRVAYDDSKSEAYQGEFLGIYHTFRDYWVFNTTDESGWTDANLVTSVIDNTSGRLEFVIEDGGTGITKGGRENKGYYLYNEGGNTDYNRATKNYGESRFVAFKYPNDGTVNATGEDHKACIKVYFKLNDDTKYQIAKFTIIFDEDTETLPWKSVNGSGQVKDSDNRDPNKLVAKAGKPIAKVSFDYPAGVTYKNPSDYTWHNKTAGNPDPLLVKGTPIDNSSPLPLTFGKTNYGFDGNDPSWGSYALVSTMNTKNGHKMTAMPADDATYGYNRAPDAGLQRAFLYIDASEQPGDICSVDFTGEFCSGGELICTGWISGSNRLGSTSCPGSVTITVKGQVGNDDEEDIYRFCPGQCYELDDGAGTDGHEGTDLHVVWQQFYFKFTINKKYDRQWLEVNNNCVSSSGGDFMLDNVEIYSLAPEVEPEMNTPVCRDKDGYTMQLLKLTVGFESLILATNANTTLENGDHDFGIVFLDKNKFIQEMKKGLLDKNHISLTFEQVEANINAGVYKDIAHTASEGGYKEAYEAAFKEALAGKWDIWDSGNPNDEATLGNGVMNFHWNHHFSQNESYTFTKAVNKTNATYGYVDPATNTKYIVMNGNYAGLKWDDNTVYYMITAKEGITNMDDVYSTFNICSDCSTDKEFQLQPSKQILSMESSDVTEDLVVCEGKIPTLVTNLTGYTINGEPKPLTGLNFDWWLGNETDLATLDNYHQQENAAGTVRLDEALYILRLYYPDVTSLDGVVPRDKDNTSAPSGMHTNHPALTQPMIDYLKSLVDAGQLILHQSSISVPAKKADGDDDPYFYLVACPIHDAAFDQALNYETDPANKYVAYFCDEPQGLRIKVGEKAPTLKCGFVPNENGFTSYDYSSVDDAVLSIRLAKKAQFEEVRHGTTADAAVDNPASATEGLHFLWLPIRDAEVQSSGSEKVIQKSDDYNVYLSSTDDPIWDKEISRKMNKDKELPIFGKIVKLEAVKKSDATTDQTSNRLCIYFIEYGETDAEKAKFDVREGYSYTLSLPFKENGTNTCDGTILINLKIVPDYEVWTGAAGNTDWNNDQNWRRADGNTTVPSVESTDESKLNNNELYVTTSLPAESGLKDYTTNYMNYRTAKDRILRKGFAPLYCTHVLMKSNEWGDAPVLYDALDGATSFTASPFPNLRDTSTPILKFDMQARLYDIWSETYGSGPGKGREGDLIAEMYQINSCDEIAFQPGAELRNAHLLNYNNAWVEYKLDMKRWYLLGSPLQGTIAGEWYAPTGTAQQKTTYYENVTFGSGYDRYSPAIYQRSWDKAKAVLYEVGAAYATTDDSQTENLGYDWEGGWNNSNTWVDPTGADDGSGADDYLDRLGYKPFGAKKANVAIKGVWSNTYNDVTVDYTKGGFSVMVLNNLKGGSNDNPAIIRIPKEDTMYDYYRILESGANDGGTDTYLSDPENQDEDDVQTNLGRAKNRGRLKTDLLLPEIENKIQRTETTVSRYGDARTYTRVPTVTTNEIDDGSVATLPMTLRSMNETVSAGISNLGYYLVENPFPCGLDMSAFFTGNTQLLKKYWIMTPSGQQLVQQASDGTWTPSDGSTFTANEAKVAPGQGFFVQLDPESTAEKPNEIKFSTDMQAQTRYGEPDDGTPYTIVVGVRQVMETVDVYYDHDDNPETPEVPLLIDHDNDPETPDVQATMEVPKVDGSGNYVVEDITEDVTIYSYKQASGDGKRFPLKTRGEEEEAILPGLVITAQRDNSVTSALVMQRSGASNDFLPSEDTEAFITSDFENVPTVYTLCGRLATTINSIHDFRSLPIGVESTSDAPCTLTFRGVEMLGDSIAFYDAVKQKLTPLESGMSFKVSGQTQNRYYLVRSLNLKDAAEETHLQIFTEGLKAKVIASTAEPITVVRCFDTAGRLICTASPQLPEYSFDLPRAGVYIIEAETENDHKTMKVIVKQ